MKEKEKKIVLLIQNMIDIILEDQNRYYVDSKLMMKLNAFFYQNSNYFDEDFIRDYMYFLEYINSFFEFLVDKLEEYELGLIDKKELDYEGIFSFDFNEFYTKKSLLEYSDIIETVQLLFPKNIALQGIIFFMHINCLLKQYKFLHNKIKIIDKVPTIEIDYTSRLHLYKEQYINIFRNELEEGIRSNRSIDDNEIINYILNEIMELKRDLYD